MRVLRTTAVRAFTGFIITSAAGLGCNTTVSGGRQVTDETGGDAAGDGDISSNPGDGDRDPGDGDGNGQIGQGGSGGQDDSNGTGGTEDSGSGGNDGSGGGTGECPAFSCCISAVTFESDEVSPLNACEGCKPAESQNEWTALDGALCNSDDNYAVAASSERYRDESCSTYCNYKENEMADEVSLSLALFGSGASTSSLRKYLELNFQNLLPMDSATIHQATLRLHVRAENAIASGTPHLIIRGSGSHDYLCDVPIDWNTSLELVECDITERVQNWLASPEAEPRLVEIWGSGKDLSIRVATTEKTNTIQRPKLILDYEVTCDGSTCPQITE